RVLFRTRPGARSPFAASGFGAAGALLLRRLADIGADGLTVRRPESGDRPAGDVALPVLRAELEGLALGLAARFDARNGTSRQSDAVRSTLAAEPLVDHLPLTEHARAAAAAPRPAPAPAPASAEAEAVPADVTAVDDPDELLDLAEESWNAQDTAAALAAYARFDEVTGTGPEAPRTGPEAPPAADASAAEWLRAARRLDGHGLALTESGALPEALDAWELTRSWFERADEPVRALAVSSRVGAVLATLGRREEAGALLTAAVEGLAALDAEPERVRGSRIRLAQFHLMGDDPQGGLAALDGVDAEDGDAAFLRGQAHGMLGQHAESVAALRTARDAFREAGLNGRLAQTSMVYAQLVTHVPEVDEEDVRAALDEAVAHAPAAADAPLLRPFAHWERGRFLLAGRRAEDAVPDLVEAVAAFTGYGRAADADQARIDLAAAYLGAGRPLEAAETIEEALAVLTRAPDGPGSGEPAGGAEELQRARVILASAQRDLGETEAADTFAEVATAETEPGVIGHFLEQSAGVLTDADRDAQAAERFLAAAEAFTQAGDLFRAVDCRRRAALCHLWAQQVEESLAVMAEARDSLSGLPADNPAAITWHTARIDYDEARLLTRLDRMPEALKLADAAIEGFTALDETDARDAVQALRQDIAASLGDEP
ncbi:hypothetical protein AB0J52_30060, partial [Spirillospora sp. NPDC049652]